MTLKTPQNLFSASGSHAPTPGASLRSFSEELLQTGWHTADENTPSSKPTSSSITLAHAFTNNSQKSTSIGNSSNNNTILEDKMFALQQQLTQVSSDFKHALKQLKDKTNQLEELENSLISTKEASRSKDLALQEAHRTLADRNSTIKEQAAQLEALTARHTEALSLTGQQLADARSTRDEEIDRVRMEVAHAKDLVETEKSALSAEYEMKLSKARAVENELRSQTFRLREENEEIRSSMLKAESKAAEAELSSQRAVSQFESVLSTLRQLESQYDMLAQDAAAAEQLKSKRIIELETEVETLRLSKAEFNEEAAQALASAGEQARHAMAAMHDAKAQHQRAEMAASDAVDALAKSRLELEDISRRCTVAEADALKWREDCALAMGELERQRGAAHAAESLLEATKMALETTRADAEMLRADAVEYKQHIRELENRLVEASKKNEEEKEKEIENECMVHAENGSVTIEEEKEPAKKNGTTDVYASADSIDKMMMMPSTAAASHCEGLSRSGNCGHAPRIDDDVFGNENENNQHHIEKEEQEEEENMNKENRRDVPGGVISTLSIPVKNINDVEYDDEVLHTTRTATTMMSNDDASYIQNGVLQEKKERIAECNEDELDEEVLLMNENARLRQQLAAMKMTFLSSANASIGAQKLNTAAASLYHHKYDYAVSTNDDGNGNEAIRAVPSVGHHNRVHSSRIDPDEALENAKRQVAVAKEYLRQLAIVDN